MIEIIKLFINSPEYSQKNLIYLVIVLTGATYVLLPILLRIIINFLKITLLNKRAGENLKIVFNGIASIFKSRMGK